MMDQWASLAGQIASCGSVLLTTWLLSDPSLSAKLNGEVDPRMPLKEYRRLYRLNRCDPMRPVHYALEDLADWL